VREALTGPDKDKWWDALCEEYNTLTAGNVFTLEELPPGRRAIGVKWIMKVKLNAKGELDKFKARLVAKGYSQVKGVDFNDTYAPVSRFTTFRALMAKAAQEELHMKQLDVKNAFLYGNLDETDIYMQQPPRLRGRNRQGMQTGQVPLRPQAGTPRVVLPHRGTPAQQWLEGDRTLIGPCSSRRMITGQHGYFSTWTTFSSSARTWRWWIKQRTCSCSASRCMRRTCPSTWEST